MHLVDASRAHPSCHYVIYGGRIWRRATGFKAETYYGPDKHYSHVHVSVDHTVQGRRSTAPWDLSR